MLDSLDNHIRYRPTLKSMPCISIALHCSCAEHPLPPVICCPNVFLPDGWDSSSSSSVPAPLHTYSSLPASNPSVCPMCTTTITMQGYVMLCHWSCPKDQRSSLPHCRSATGACSPAHACSTQPRTTSREWLGGLSSSSGHASHLSNDELTPFMRRFWLPYFLWSGVSSHFSILEILFLFGLASIYLIVTRNDMESTFCTQKHFEWWSIW